MYYRNENGGYAETYEFEPPQHHALSLQRAEPHPKIVEARRNAILDRKYAEEMRLPFNHYAVTSTLRALGGYSEYHGEVSQSALVELRNIAKDNEKKRTADVIPLFLTKNTK